jgi:hypothetical protein
VAPLGPASLPSGILQDWPTGAPLTLHSLAALMISRSDNTATDTLLAALGREKVERLLAELGVTAPAGLRPFLSTREAFALKLGPASGLDLWKKADEPGRRALLRGIASAEAKSFDPARLASAPLANDVVEWFASPADLVRTLDWLRRSGDETALKLLAINPGLDPTLARGFGYFGYKGGSEPGVLSLSFLMRRRGGEWLALSVAWNDPKRPLEETKLAGLVQRLIALLD